MKLPNRKFHDAAGLDKGTLTAHASEVHPVRDKPPIAGNVQCRLYEVITTPHGHQVTADIFTPRTIPETPRPAILFLHGGCWWAGNPSQFHFHANHFASKYGFFAASLDYRLSHVAPFPAALQDAKCAIRYIRSLARAQNIDTGRIAVCGGSAGGHLASMMLTTNGFAEYEGDGGYQTFSSDVNLGMILNGEFDMWDLVAKGSLLAPMKQFMQGTPEAIPEKYDELSSVKRVHGDVPPVLLLHGTEDECVSHHQSIAFHQKLVQCGVRAELAIYEGKPHAWFNFEPDRAITLKRMERFVCDTFDPARTAS